jgi:hypothetical protein
MEMAGSLNKHIARVDFIPLHGYNRHIRKTREVAMSLQESISKIRNEDFDGQNDVSVYLDMDRGEVYCSAGLSADLQLFSVEPGCKAESVRQFLMGKESAINGLIESNKSKNFNEFRFWSAFISGGRPQLSYSWEAEDWFQTPAPGFSTRAQARPEPTEI